MCLLEKKQIAGVKVRMEWRRGESSKMAENLEGCKRYLPPDETSYTINGQQDRQACMSDELRDSYHQDVISAQNRGLID